VGGGGWNGVQRLIVQNGGRARVTPKDQPGSAVLAEMKQNLHYVHLGC